MSIIFLDTETIGLNGFLKTIQYSYLGEDKVHIIFCDNKKKAFDFLNEINKPYITIVGYNIGFDIYHMYKFFAPSTAFEFNCIDLYNHVRLNKELGNQIDLKSKKNIVLKKVPILNYKEILTYVLEKLKEKTNLSFKSTLSNKKNNFIDLHFFLEGSMKLKTIMKNWGFETQDIINVWPIVDRNNEKMHILNNNPQIYIEANKKANEILNTKESSFIKYAQDDVIYLKILYGKLNNPCENKHDTITHIVAYTRYKGFNFNKEYLKNLLIVYLQEIKNIFIKYPNLNLKSSKQKLEFLRNRDPLIQNTSKKYLQKTQVLIDKDNPIYEIINDFIKYGSLLQRQNQVKKILENSDNRIHPNFKVLGTTSLRMSGTGSLNFQGIEREKQGIRKSILTKAGGDFDAQEITIAAAFYKDSQMQKDLDNRIDLHIKTALIFSPSMKNITYDYAINHKKEPNIAFARQEHGKTINFALIYGASVFKIASILGITEDETIKKYNAYAKEYSGVTTFRENLEKEICTIEKKGWNIEEIQKMKTEIANLHGEKRFFEIQRNLVKIFWNIAHTQLVKNLNFQNKPLIRNKQNKQSTGEMLKASMLGCAANIQKTLFRQIINYPIQSTGASMTKLLMIEIWKNTRIPIMNIHDELIFPNDISEKDYENIKLAEKTFLERERKIVPSLFINIKKINNWSEK